MIIDKEKHYRTRDGREVRIYALDGAVIGAAAPVHGAVKTVYGWECTTWYLDGRWTSADNSDGDLIETDPHGILPRHRELLAEAMSEHKHDFGEWVEIVRTGTFASLSPDQHVALIALAKQGAKKAK